MLGKKRIGIYPAGPMHWFDRASGSFRIVYERIPQNQDEVDQFVYSTLQLPMTGLNGGAGVPYGRNIAAFSPGMLAKEQAIPQGMPYASGSYGSNPLIGS